MTYNPAMENKMSNRADFLKLLYESPAYKHALTTARSDAERKAVASIVGDFVGGFADVLGPLIARAKKDPAFAEQLGKAVAERRSVVTNMTPASSGSNG